MNFKISFQGKKDIPVSEDEHTSFDIEISYDVEISVDGKKVSYVISGEDYHSGDDEPMFWAVEEIKHCLDRILDQKKIDAQEETFELK